MGKKCGPIIIGPIIGRQGPPGFETTVGWIGSEVEGLNWTRLLGTEMTMNLRETLEATGSVGSVGFSGALYH